MRAQRRKQMNKGQKYSLLILLVCSLYSSAQATIKFDAGRSVGEIAKSVTEQVRNTVDKAQKQLEHFKTYQKMVDGAKEGMNKINEIKSQVEEAKSAINSVKNSAQSLKDAANSATGIVSEATSAVSDVAGSVNIEGAQELIRLQNDLAQMKASYEAEIQDITSDYEAEVGPYKENNQLIEEQIAQDPGQKTILQVQIEENNAKIAEIDKKYKEQLAQAAKDFAIENDVVQEQINKLKEKVNLDSLDAEGAKKALSGLFGGDASAAMNEVIAKNFYKENEEDSSENNKRITDYRASVFREDSADVYFQAVALMSEGDASLDLVEKLQSNAQVVETTPAAVTLDISNKIQNMKVLLKFARLLVAEMKMSTAKDMISISKKLHNYGKDVTTFNLDDYEYNEELMQKLKVARDKANKLKITIKNSYEEESKADLVGATTDNQTAATAGRTQLLSTTKSKLGNLFQSVKTLLFIISGFGLVGIAFMAIRGRMSWKWFAMLAAGLAILAAAGALIEYATGDNSVRGYFGDTISNATGY